MAAEPPAAAAAKTSMPSRLLAWLATTLPPLLSGIGVAGLVSVLGAVILWARFDTAGLPADQAVGDLPTSSLLVTGAVSLVLYLVLGLLAVLIVYLLQTVVVSIMGGGDELQKARKQKQRELKVVQQHLDELARQASGLKALDLAADPALISQIQDALNLRDELARKLYEAQLTRVRQEPPSTQLGNQWGLLLLIGAEIVLVVIRTKIQGAEKACLLMTLAAMLAAVALVFYLSSPKARKRKGCRVGPSAGVLICAIAFAPFLGFSLAWLHVWTLVPLLAVVVLGAINLAVGRVHPKRFFWYGASIFISVALFGSILTYSRNANAPSMQPAVVLLKNGQVVTGLWIGESSSRVFLADIGDANGTVVSSTRSCPITPSAEAEGAVGRIFWLDRAQVDSESIGKLARIPDARRRAEGMGCDLEALASRTQATRSQP